MEPWDAWFLVGGGHAHLTCLRSLRDFSAAGHEAVVIGPDEHHYYSGMGPGMLGGTYRPQEIRFNIKKMTEAGGGRFIQGTVSRVFPQEKRLELASGETLTYDVVSFNTGSRVPSNGVAIRDEAEVYTVKPIEQLLKARQVILNRLKYGPLGLLVAGGGPAGVEISGNLWRLVSRAAGKAQITLLAGGRLLAGQPDKVRNLALKSFRRRKIEVIVGEHLKEIRPKTAVMAGGGELAFDLAFLALGVEPYGLFRDSGLPTGPDGGLLVNQFLQSTAWPEIFGGGDCIYFQPQPLDKVGVHAVRENPILFQNLLAALSGRSLIPFKHIGIYGYRASFLRKFVALPQGKLENIEKLEQLRALEHGYRIKVVISDKDSLEVDRPSDLAKVEALLKSQGG